MPDRTLTFCTAFDGPRRLASGPLRQVAEAVKARVDGGQAEDVAPSVLVLDDETGRVIDLDLRGTPEDVVARLGGPQEQPEKPRGRGRPRLGVVPREVTLLPRHWEWLSAQPGGASVTLRKLVEEARRAGTASERRRLAQERAYRFMAALAGDAPGYEEALRALYAGNAAAFETHIQPWPVDVREHARKLAQAAFESGL
ncbi:DUF2239 family protein [Geothrix paludis]|uniref:DUF2239 family protein n=1 Tax=Geothrix paludis TaxID=2922722 RepID=UPI001FACA0AB|nr:DUF2239 family protein [Geothrix paludis]